jgi:hypothetical protein
MTTIPNTTNGIAQGLSGDGVPPLLAKREEPKKDVDSELMGDPRVMMSRPLSPAEIVDSISTGNPVGLEHLNLGTDHRGNPMAIWYDDKGFLQTTKLSTSQWMGIKEARSLNRSKMGQRMQERKQLAEDREELRPSFEHSLDMVDIEPYRALLTQQFEDNPQLATKNLVDFLRLNQIDDKKAAAVADAAMAEAANAVAQRQHGGFVNGIASHDATVKQRHADAVQKGGKDIDELVMAQQHHDRRINAIRGGAVYAPTPRNARNRPSQAYGSNVVTTYEAWLKMLAEGIPNPDGSISSFTIPHPSAPDFESRKAEILQQIQRIEGMLGWQERSNGDDMNQIMAAVNNHYSVHGEAIHIQTLQDENDKLRKQIEELEKLPVDEGGGAQPAMRAELESQQEAITEFSAMDIDKSGTIEDWEQKWDQPAHEKRVATAEGQRAGAKAQRSGAARAAKAEAVAESNKEKAKIRDAVDALMYGDTDSEGLEDLRREKVLWDKKHGVDEDNDEKTPDVVEPPFPADRQKKLDEMEGELAGWIEQRKRLGDPTYEDLMAHLAGTKWEGSADSFADAVEAKDADAVAINDRWMNYEQPQTK